MKATQVVCNHIGGVQITQKRCAINASTQNPDTDPGHTHTLSGGVQSVRLHINPDTDPGLKHTLYHRTCEEFHQSTLGKGCQTRSQLISFLKLPV